MVMPVFAACAGFGAIAIWSLSPALIKTSSVSVELAELLMTRYTLAALCFLPWLLPVWRKRKQISKKQWSMLALAMNAHIFLQGYCLQLVSVSWYVVIFSLSPFITFILMRLRLSFMKLIAVLLSGSGTLFFIDPFEMQELPSIHGLLAVVGTTITWALITTQLAHLQRLYKDVEIVTVLTYFLFMGSFLLWAPSHCSFAAVSQLSNASLGCIALLAVGMPLAFVLFAFCLRVMPVFGISSQYLELVFGLMVGVLLFDDLFSAKQMLGTMLVVFGLVLLMIPEAKVFKFQIFSVMREKIQRYRGRFISPV